MDGIRIGYMPTRLSGTGAETWRRAVRQAEDADLDHLAVGDHVSFYVGAGFDGLLGAVPYVASGCSTFNLILNGASPESEIEAAAEIRARMLEAVA